MRKRSVASLFALTNAWLHDGKALGWSFCQEISVSIVFFIIFVSDCLLVASQVNKVSMNGC